MTKTLGSSLLALVVVCAPALARADPFSITSTVSTTGMFRCHDFAICIGGGSSITLPSGSGSATITYTGFTTTFDVTTTVSTVCGGPPSSGGPLPSIAVFRAVLCSSRDSCGYRI